MTEIKELTHFNPLGSNLSWESSFVKVVEHKELTITTKADVNLELHINFSINGYDDGQLTTLKILAGDWATRNIRRSLPYVKFTLKALSDKPNNELVLVVMGSKVLEEKKISEKHQYNDNEQPEEHRSKSPFKNILKGRRKSVGKVTDRCNCKIPEHVPRGAILVGDWDSKLKVIPPPVLGIPEVQLLTYCQDSGFEWQLLNLDDKYDKSEKTVSWFNNN